MMGAAQRPGKMPKHGNNLVFAFYGENANPCELYPKTVGI
jgi:hypothetical protein